MSNDVNEDLIEATIRRVAEAKAAQQAAGARVKAEEAASSPPQPPDDDAGENDEASPQGSADEDLIEATIRRVTAAKAARESGSDQPAADDAAPRDAMELVAGDVDAPSPAVAELDEDLIEATIRRVKATKAERDGEPPVAAADEPAPASAHVEDAIAAAEEAVPEVPSPAPSPLRDGPTVAAAAPQRTADETDSAPQPWPEFAGRIERRLEATAAAVEAVVARLDALMSMVERLANAATPPLSTGPRQAPPTPRATDDDWDEAPVVPKMPIGMPPRPAILRDPSPMTATAEQLEEAPVAEEVAPQLDPAPVVDNRPLPKPLPPLHVEQKRGLDLLPRSYRITVEDKRKGVDLVPLHRALLGMDGVKDMSLLSYNNGIAMVSLETVSDLDAESLGRAVSRAMSRDAQVEVHNESTMVVKLGDD